MDTLMQNPFQSRASSIALSKTRSESLQNSTNWSFRQDAVYDKKFASGDYFTINPVFIHSQQTGTEHNSYQLNYIQGSGQDDYRHRYNKSPNHSNRFDTYIKYTYNVNSELSLLFGTYFIWEQTHEEHERYRLERLDGWSAEQALGALSSTREAMLKGFDNQNSYVEDYSEFLNRYYVNLSYRKNRGNHRNTLDIRVPLKFITDALVN